MQFPEVGLRVFRPHPAVHLPLWGGSYGYLVIERVLARFLKTDQSANLNQDTVYRWLASVLSETVQQFIFLMVSEPLDLFGIKHMLGCSSQRWFSVLSGLNL
jgi:hypothetical protein